MNTSVIGALGIDVGALGITVGDIVAGDVDAAIRLAIEVGDGVPLPGSGRTLQRWNLLAGVAAADLTTARVLEAHLDALAIIAESGASAPSGSSWGVFAAEQPGSRVEAYGDDVGGWRLTGRKPWCSLADRLSDGLITAHVGERRRLFAVSLRHEGVTVAPDAWHARGLQAVTSGPIDLHDVPATPVGAVDWYLHRPGFAHGGLGVAACWFGGAVGVARALTRAARRRELDQIGAWHLGQVDVALTVARAALRDAAAQVDDAQVDDAQVDGGPIDGAQVDGGPIDGGPIDGGQAADADGEVLALRVRAVVAGAAERLLEHVGHALGPAPLTSDADHARRVADLTVYLRQHHAERDVARLGHAVAAMATDPW